MHAQKIQIEVKAITKPEAESKAKLLAEIGNNLDTEALQILRDASNRPGMNKTIKDYKQVLMTL